MNFIVKDVKMSNSIIIAIKDQPIAHMVRLEDNGIGWYVMPENLVHDNMSSKGYGNMGRVIVSNYDLSRMHAMHVGS